MFEILDSGNIVQIAKTNIDHPALEVRSRMLKVLGENSNQQQGNFQHSINSKIDSYLTIPLQTPCLDQVSWSSENCGRFPRLRMLFQTFQSITPVLFS